MRISLPLSPGAFLRPIAYVALGILVTLAVVSLRKAPTSMGPPPPPPPGFATAVISSEPPKEAPKPAVKGGELLAYGHAAFGFEEKAPPQVFGDSGAKTQVENPTLSDSGAKTQPAIPPNWKLRPGDLAGEAAFTIEKVHGVVVGSITQRCFAQTPLGVIGSPELKTPVPPDKLWGNASAFGYKPEFDLMFGASTAPGLEAGARWKRAARRTGGYVLVEWRPDALTDQLEVHGGLTVRIGRK